MQRKFRNLDATIKGESELTDIRRRLATLKQENAQVRVGAFIEMTSNPSPP
jgi:hypothetical protein